MGLFEFGVREPELHDREIHRTKHPMFRHRTKQPMALVYLYYHLVNVYITMENHYF